MKVTFWDKVKNFFEIKRLTQEQKCSIGEHAWGEVQVWYDEYYYKDYPFGDSYTYQVCEFCGEEKYIETLY